MSNVYVAIFWKYLLSPCAPLVVLLPSPSCERERERSISGYGFSRDRGKTVHFCWVSGHVGVAGNEKNRPESCYCPQSLCCQGLIFPFLSSAPTRWLTLRQNIGTNKLRAFKDSVSAWSTSCRQNRFHKVILSRLRIGHTWLTHQHLLRGHEPPLCNDCFVSLTVCHFLTECPTHIVQRRRFFGSDGVLRPVALRSILRDNEDAVLVLLGFLVSAGLINSL